LTKNSRFRSLLKDLTLRKSNKTINQSNSNSNAAIKKKKKISSAQSLQVKIDSSSIKYLIS
jgi:hypothetical protein